MGEIRILRKTHVPMKMKIEHPKIQFYANKIGELIFPGSFVNFSIVRVPKKWVPQKTSKGTTYPSGIEFYSEEVNVSRFHKKYMDAISKPWKKRTEEQDRLIDSYLEKRDIESSNNSSASKRFSQLKKAGFFVNDHPGNIDLIKGKPLFFEVSIENPFKLKEFILRTKPRKGFSAQKKERALRIADRLIELWEEIK